MRLRLPHCLCTITVLALLSGCATQTSVAPALPEGLTGRVHGGQQPVSGATIQLYTVGTTGDGSTATPILSQTIKTTAAGTFNITGLYNNCAGATQVYITATGGNPGLSAANPNLALMAALGACSSLTSSQFIDIDEVTTVAAVAALAPYMSASGSVGSAPSDLSSLLSAFTLASEYANTATGTSPGVSVPSGYAVPTALINTLADVLSTCVNSTGGTAYDLSACGDLFEATTINYGTPPANTITALLNLINNPNTSTFALYNLISSNPPFLPNLASAPPNFGLRLAPVGTAAGLSLSASALTFPATGLFQQSPTQTLTLQNIGTAAITLNLTSLVTLGENASSFTVSSGCAATLQPSGTCSVVVGFVPTVPGNLSGFLQVISSASASPQYVSLSGSGTANSSSPSNIFYTSQAGTTQAPTAGLILTLPVSSNGSSTPAVTYTLPGSAFSQIRSDGKGNLYAVTSSLTTYATSIQVFSIGAGGVLTPTRSFALASGLQVYDMAVDSSGRVFIAFYNQSTSQDEINVYAAGATGTPSPTFTIKNYGSYLAVDASNNLFALDANGNIVEFAAGFTASSTPSRSINLTSIYGSCIGGPNGLAVDASGNVYIDLDGGATCVNEMLEFTPSASGAASPTRTIGGTATQLNTPYYSLTFDRNGTMYVPDNLSSGQPVIFEWISTANGNVAPSTFVVPAGIQYGGYVAVY